METTNDRQGLSLRAIAAITLVTAIWGFNFVVIKVGVRGVPPLLLAACRFSLSAFPAILFVRRPAVPIARLASYGALLGVGEFGLLFTAIKLGAPAGQSSIILQAQAFFTAILAALFFGERMRATSLIGMIVAAVALAMIAVSGGSTAGARAAQSAHVSAAALFPLAMVVLAALFWAGANIVAQRMPKTDGLSLMVWSSPFAALPLFVLSFALERDSIPAAIAGLAPISVGALAYLVILSTLLGYGVWNQFIMKCGAGKIAPFSLLVPVFGVTSGALVLGESFTAVDAIASALVLAGLAIHAFGGRLRPRADASR